jgi:hypothetical protein
MSIALSLTFRETLARDGVLPAGFQVNPRDPQVSNVTWLPTVDAAIQHLHGWLNGGRPPPRQQPMVRRNGAAHPLRADRSLQSPTISLAAGALRSSGIETIGSGLGSVSSDDLIRSATGFLDAILPGKFDIAAQSVPLRDVSEAWMRDRPKERVVLTMSVAASTATCIATW